jgi:hypothetical protein
VTAIKDVCLSHVLKMEVPMYVCAHDREGEREILRESNL